MDEKMIMQIRLECLREAVKTSEPQTEVKDILSRARKMEKFVMKNIGTDNTNK